MNIRLIQASSCAKARFLGKEHAKYPFDQPFLEIQLDGPLPKIEAPFKAVSLDDGTFYYTYDDFRANFYVHHPKNESGYAGSVFKTPLEDGTEVDVRGPWSSRESIYNLFVPEELHAVHGSAYEPDRLTGWAISPLVSRVREMLPEGFRIIRDGGWEDYGAGEIRYDTWHDGCSSIIRITLEDGTIKHYNSYPLGFDGNKGEQPEGYYVRPDGYFSKFSFPKKNGPPVKTEIYDDPSRYPNDPIQTYTA